MITTSAPRSEFRSFTDFRPTATCAATPNHRKSDVSFLTPEIKVEVENTDERSIDESNTSDDQFMVKSEVLEVLREDDLAELNQNSEVTRLSRNGAISINFRSSTKPELFFLLRDEKKDSLSEGVPTTVLMLPRVYIIGWL